MEFCACEDLVKHISQNYLPVWIASCNPNVHPGARQAAAFGLGKFAKWVNPSEVPAMLQSLKSVIDHPGKFNYFFFILHSSLLSDSRSSEDIEPTENAISSFGKKLC